MPKIAVLISGEYRKFDITRKTMRFLDDPEIDVYVSTWDRTIYENKKINLRLEEVVSRDKILKELGRPATILLNSHNSFTEFKYNSKMINRWLYGFSLIKNSKIKYDYVAVLRTDLFFSESKPFDNLEKYKDSIGFTWATSMHLGKLPDVFFLSSYDLIDKLFTNMSLTDWAQSPLFDWHEYWFKYVTNLVPVIDLSEYDRLTFCRLWADENSTMQDIIKIQEDWRDITLLQQCDTFGDTMGLVWPEHVLPSAREKWNSGYFDKYKNEGSNI